MRFQFLFSAALATSLLMSPSITQAQKKSPSPQKNRASQKKQARPKSPVGFPGLLPALKKSPGCLGVETARTSSGKNVIFAWFKDKKAAMDWYYSDAHLKVMGGFIPQGTDRKPLAGIADDVGPIMAIASITFTDKPKLKGVNMPISQIAIELYAPLKGGLSLGGTFAPASLKKVKK